MITFAVLWMVFCYTTSRIKLKLVIPFFCHSLKELWNIKSVLYYQMTWLLFNFLDETWAHICFSSYLRYSINIVIISFDVDLSVEVVIRCFHYPRHTLGVSDVPGRTAAWSWCIWLPLIKASICLMSSRVLFGHWLNVFYVNQTANESVRKDICKHFDLRAHINCLLHP